MSTLGHSANRRLFLQSAAALAAAGLAPIASAAPQSNTASALPDDANYVDLPQIHAPTDALRIRPHQPYPQTHPTCLTHPRPRAA